MNSYRLTSMEEPGDERMAQIMREVAEDARESTRRAAERVAAGIEAASQAAQEKWGDAVNRIKNDNKWASSRFDCDCLIFRNGLGQFF